MSDAGRAGTVLRGVRGARLVREPLVQFGVLALAVFAMHAAAAPKPRVVRVTAAQMQALVQEREAVLGRPMSAVERQRLAMGFVDQEILLREALAHGLETTDARVRQRLASKMLFLLEEEPPEPTEEELQSFYESHRSSYSTQPSVSFEHSFFTSPPDDPAATLAALESGTPFRAVGEPFWMGAKLERITDAEMRTILGAEFVSSVLKLEARRWYGPLRSERGTHFVRVLAFHDSEPLPEGLARSRLREDWARAWRSESREQSLATLRARYQIVIEPEGDAS